MGAQQRNPIISRIKSILTIILCMLTLFIILLMILLIILTIILSSNRTYSYCYENWVGEGIAGPTGRSLYTVTIMIVLVFMMSWMRIMRGRRRMVMVLCSLICCYGDGESKKEQQPYIVVL